MTDDEGILQARGVRKSFGGPLVLDGVDLSVRAGEVHALLGENGAGKSTLIKILAGAYLADAGEFSVAGRSVDPSHGGLPGLAFVHQDLALVDDMTVAENVAFTMGYPRSRGKWISWAAVRDQAADALAVVGGKIDGERSVADLTFAERSLVAIARGLAAGGIRALVLDEPTAGLPEHDVAALFAAIAQVRDQGVAIIYVTHRIDEVFRITDRVTVLRDGRVVLTCPTGDLTAQELSRAIMGRSVAAHAAAAIAAVAPAGSGGLRLQGLRTAMAGPIDETIAPGTVIGFTGLRGAGQDLIGRAIFGIEALTDGCARLDDEVLPNGDPHAAVAAGIGFVSASRSTDGVAPGLTLRENLWPNPRLLDRTRILSRTAERERANAALRRYLVQPDSAAEASIDILSGGNQQKVILGRWMEARTRVLVLEEPTAGVDVGGRAEIYGLVRDYVGAGGIAIITSSDYKEIAQLCHRALVFHDGVVAGSSEAPISADWIAHVASGAEVQTSLTR